MRIVLLFAVVSVLAGCGTVPPEVKVAADKTAAEVQNLAQWHSEVVRDYDRELRAAYRSDLDHVLAYELAKPGADPSDLVSKRDAKWLQIEAKLDSARDRYQNNPSFGNVVTVLQALGRWVGMVSESARNFEEALRLLGIQEPSK